MKPISASLWKNRHSDQEKLEAAVRGDSGWGWLMRWLPSRAHDNGFFTLFSNGVELDNGDARTGNAMIIDPYGRIVSETGSFEDTIVCADLDLDLLAMSTGRRCTEFCVNLRATSGMPGQHDFLMMSLPLEGKTGKEPQIRLNRVYPKNTTR